jgi:hypothetical protein
MAPIMGKNKKEVGQVHKNSVHEEKLNSTC